MLVKQQVNTPEDTEESLHRLHLDPPREPCGAQDPASRDKRGAEQKPVFLKTFQFLGCKNGLLAL